MKEGHHIFRLRVKQKHSGTYGMYRKCDQQNRFCEDGTGKFNRLPWIDLTVTYVSDYRSHSPGVTVDKTFTVDGNGRATVRWDFTADVVKFPRMGITVEPDDGNPVHTTQRVLAGARPLAPLG